jgi:formylglycine-generating enzyme required for sulfatase activity
MERTIEMISVVYHRHTLQWCLAFLAALSVAAILGCQRGEETKKEPPAGEQPAAEPPAPELPGYEEGLPALEPDTKTPAEKPAKEQVNEPAKKKPAKKRTDELPGLDSPAPAKTSSVRVPAAGWFGSEAYGAEIAQPVTSPDAPADSDPSLEVAVKWLPKPPVENPAAEAKDQAAMKPYTERISGTDVTFDMVPIPGGTFKMGSPVGEKDRKDDEGPQVTVKLDPFWMEKHEVTWNEYNLWGLGLDKQRREVKKTAAGSWDTLADALAIPTKPYSDMTFGMGKDGYPAVCMTQFAAKMYCKWLSAKTGHYYRLPTEAEWEYACRAGTTTAYSFGDDPEKLGDYAWYADNSDEKYHKVGTKKPNPWGLYDMHGNVAEWCLDQYVPDAYKQLGEKLAKLPPKNPLFGVTKSYPQVVRGGAWTDEAPLLRSAARRGSSKEWKAQDPQLPQSIWYHTDADFVGFRVVRPLRVPTPEEAARYEVTEFEKQEFLDYKKVQGGKQ